MEHTIKVKRAVPYMEESKIVDLLPALNIKKNMYTEEMAKNIAELSIHISNVMTNILDAENEILPHDHKYNINKVKILLKIIEILMDN